MTTGTHWISTFYIVKRTARNMYRSEKNLCKTNIVIVLNATPETIIYINREKITLFLSAGFGNFVVLLCTAQRKLSSVNVHSLTPPLATETDSDGSLYDT